MHAYDVHKTQFQDEFSSHRLQLGYCVSASYSRNSSSPLRGPESAVELWALPILLLPESWQEPSVVGHHISLFKHEPVAPPRGSFLNTLPKHKPTEQTPPRPSVTTRGPLQCPFPLRRQVRLHSFAQLPVPHPLHTLKTSGRATVVQHPAPKHLMLRPGASPNAARSRRAAPACAHCLGSLPSRWGEPKPGSSGGRGASTKGTKLVRKRRHCLMFPARPPAPPLWTAFA